MDKSDAEQSKKIKKLEETVNKLIVSSKRCTAENKRQQILIKRLTNKVEVLTAKINSTQ